MTDYLRRIYLFYLRDGRRRQTPHARVRGRFISAPRSLVTDDFVSETSIVALQIAYARTVSFSCRVLDICDHFGPP